MRGVEEVDGAAAVRDERRLQAQRLQHLHLQHVHGSIISVMSYQKQRAERHSIIHVQCIHVHVRMVVDIDNLYFKQ